MVDDNKDFVVQQQIDLSQAKRTPMQRELQAEVGDYMRKQQELQKRLEDWFNKR